MIFLETSALDNTNVTEMFHKMVEAVCERFADSGHGSEVDHSDTNFYRGQSLANAELQR